MSRDCCESGCSGAFGTPSTWSADGIPILVLKIANTCFAFKILVLTITTQLILVLTITTLVPGLGRGVCLAPVETPPPVVPP